MIELPKVFLRAVELDDTALIMQWENDSSEWQHSGTTIPFSRYQVEQYVLSASADFWASRQLRLMIVNQEGQTVGAVDLFDADPVNRRAGLGITIAREYRRQGFGRAGLLMMTETAFSRIGLHQIWCNIASDNRPSIILFESEGWHRCGLLPQWQFFNGCYHDVYFYQLLNPNH